MTSSTSDRARASAANPAPISPSSPTTSALSPDGVELPDGLELPYTAAKPR